MPVTIKCSSVQPEAFELQDPVNNPSQLFKSAKAAKAEHNESMAEMLSMVDPESKLEKANKAVPYREKLLRVALSCPPPPEGRITARENGLVHALQAAYTHHHHLTLRPDDVWISILTQFSIYVNKNAETLRSTFVTHKDQKKLTVTSGGNITSVDFGEMARQMGLLLQANVKDADLRNWIVPNFTTTTQNDVIVASVIMMATLQAYFKFAFSLLCGIPSVTLLGTREDWSSLRNRIEKLDSFGEEPQKWANLLRPVCDSFVACFDNDTEVDQARSANFWSRVCHKVSGGSGPTYLCGWATVLCVWDDEGNWQGESGVTPSNRYEVEGRVEKEHEAWPIIDASKVPRACAEVPVHVDDNGEPNNTIMMAGLPGIHIGSNGAGEDVLSPVAGWAMFKVPD